MDRLIRIIIFAILGFVIGSVFPAMSFALVTGADMSNLPEEIFNKCGVVSGTFAFGCFFFAAQSAKRQKAWDEDRSGMMKMLVAQDERDLKVTAVISEVKGLLLAVQSHR